jgi:hypothetical protein
MVRKATPVRRPYLRVKSPFQSLFVPSAWTKNLDNEALAVGADQQSANAMMSEVYQRDTGDMGRGG